MAFNPKTFFGIQPKSLFWHFNPKAFHGIQYNTPLWHSNPKAFYVIPSIHNGMCSIETIHMAGIARSSSVSTAVPLAVAMESTAVPSEAAIESLGLPSEVPEDEVHVADQAHHADPTQAVDHGQNGDPEQNHGGDQTQVVPQEVQEQNQGEVENQGHDGNLPHWLQVTPDGNTVFYAHPHGGFQVLDPHGVTQPYGHALGWPGTSRRPGPPPIVDLSQLLPPWVQNAHNWSQMCATEGCPSWVYLTRTRLPTSQRCPECNRPWIQSYWMKGPHNLH